MRILWKTLTTTVIVGLLAFNIALTASTALLGAVTDIARWAGVRGGIVSLATDLATARTERDAARTERDAAQKRAAAADTRRAEAERTRDGAIRDRDAARADLTGERAKRRAAEDALETARADLKATTTRATALEADLAQERTRSGQLAVSLDQTRPRLRSLEDELAQAAVKLKLSLDKVARLDAAAAATRRTVTGITERIERRAVASAVRNIGSLPFETVPIVGISVIVGVTALDVYDVCQTAQDMAELRRMIGLAENPQGGAQFCGFVVSAPDAASDALTACMQAMGPFVPASEARELCGQRHLALCAETTDRQARDLMACPAGGIVLPK